MFLLLLTIAALLGVASGLASSRFLPALGRSDRTLIPITLLAFACFALGAFMNVATPYLVPAAVIIFMTGLTARAVALLRAAKSPRHT